MKPIKTILFYSIPIGVVALLIVLVARDGTGAASKTERTTREVALSCTTDMATQFHIHPSVQIVVNGQTQGIPAGIGVKAGCMNPLHTHDGTGKIHVESPEKRDFTVADFFAVWGKPFSRDRILDWKADDTHAIRMTVNGAETDAFENYVFRDLDKVVITYEENKE